MPRYNESIPATRPLGPSTPDATPDYLHVRSGGQQALEDLYAAYAETPGNCAGKEPLFTDYDVLGYWPGRNEAEAFCANCPVFDLCKKAAELTHPAHGIWAGEVYGKEGRG